MVHALIVQVVAAAFMVAIGLAKPETNHCPRCSPACCGNPTPIVPA